MKFTPKSMRSSAASDLVIHRSPCPDSPAPKLTVETPARTSQFAILHEHLNQIPMPIRGLPKLPAQPLP
jgi:hypothetical protein